MQGFYGEVYKGTLERDKDMEPQLVAIKKLKTNAVETSLQDFEREITIMKVSYSWKHCILHHITAFLGHLKAMYFEHIVQICLNP